jgi:hypothetical protein
MTEKRPCWENEMMGGKHVSEDIVCKTCLLRFYETDGVKIDKPDASICQIYEYPESKPNAVYFDGADCDYYEKD